MNSPEGRARELTRAETMQFKAQIMEDKMLMADLVDQYFAKSLRTCQGLMKLMNIAFHYERLKQKYIHDQSAETVLILLTRARKMYDAIGALLTIFKLID